MSRFRIINIIDSAFICLIVFLLTFVFVQFFILSIPLSILISIIIASIILLTFRYVSSKKQNKKSMFDNEKKEQELFYINFLSYTKSYRLKCIAKLLPTDTNKTISKDSINYQIDNKNYIIILQDNNITITQNEIIGALKENQKYEKIIIICCNYSNEIKDFASSLKEYKIELINYFDLYKIMSKNKIKIKNKISLDIKKINILAIFRAFFAKKHAKGFFFSGLILVFTSLFIPFKLYYIILSVILLSFSLICLIKPEKVISKNIFK